MVAFRKLFPAFAMFALTTIGANSAFAQGPGFLPLSCNANAGVPPVVRAEGYTELTGDLVVTCTGGNSAQPFLANFQLFLNTNITSRLFTAGTEVSEALLMIDEPGLPRTDAGGINPGVPTPFCVSPSPAANPTPAFYTPTGGSPIPQIGLPPTGQTAPTCNNAVVGGGPAGQTFQQGTYNVFRGARQQGNPENVVVWQGIPVVPPGSNLTRTFRITNVRANATGLGSSQTLIPTQIVAYISVFPQGTLPIDNPQQTVGYVQTGLLFDTTNCTGGGNPTFNQCVGISTDRFNTPSSGGLPSGNSTPASIFGLRYREGFQTAFKPRIVLPGSAVPGFSGSATDQANSLPGQVFNSESGFVNPATGAAGIADTGTRVAARFVNVPANVRIFVSTASVDSISSGAQAVLVTADVNGASNFAGLGATAGAPQQVFGPVTLTCIAGGVAGIEIPLTAGSGTAVWEIVNSNPSSNDTLQFYAGFAYRANAAAGQPALGQAQVIGNFAPFYAAGSSPNPGSASAGLPIPRFTASTTATNLFRINACQTNLLFPYVTNFAGFDTGIAIANTSADPFSAANANNGRCTINYYGVLANGNPPTTTREQTDRELAAGATLTFILSGGGSYGLRGNPNFQGYIIAQCDFLYAHGFAFITDGPIGQARVAEGYLALVIDGPTSNGSLRGNTLGEGLGN